MFFLKKIKNCNFNQGFTIVEMIVGAFIFSMVLIVSVASVLSIVSANQQALAIKSVFNNLNYSIEGMVRDLRTGYSYNCGTVTNCPRQGAGGGGSTVGFTSSAGSVSGYRLNAGKIQKLFGSSWEDITGSETNIDRLQFFVSGVGQDQKQPTIFLVLAGYVTFRNNRQIKFSLSTLAVQRKIEGAERP